LVALDATLDAVLDAALTTLAGTCNNFVDAALVLLNKADKFLFIAEGAVADADAGDADAGDAGAVAAASPLFAENILDNDLVKDDIKPSSLLLLLLFCLEPFPFVDIVAYIQMI